LKQGQFAGASAPFGVRIEGIFEANCYFRNKRRSEFDCIYGTLGLLMHLLSKKSLDIAISRVSFKVLIRTPLLQAALIRFGSPKFKKSLKWKPS